MNAPPRLAVFADVQNIYYTTRDRFGRAFDYRALWRRLADQGEVVCAIAYAIHRPGDDGQRRFRDALSHIGFTVRTKPWIERSDGSAKGDFDVGITIDVLDMAPSVDVVVLLSGDGDFAELLETVSARYGTGAWVYGVPGLTALSLQQAASRYVPIDESLLV